MKILLTGAAGNLGQALSRRLTPKNEVIAVDIVGDVDHLLDITDYTACQSFITEVAPDFILHPAAWTDVDGCALDPDRALLVNGIGTHNLAAISAALGIPILYVSTNEVFAGDQTEPYHEYDSPKPVNAYGASKRYGERAVAQVNPRHYIVRSSWLFAHSGRNFIGAILGAAADGKSLRVVTNEVANPTYTEDLADAIVSLIASQRYGTYHLVNEGAVSRWGLARFVLDQAGFAETPVERISSHQWPRPTQPPEYSSLANIAGAGIGIRLRPWRDAVAAFLDREAAS